MNQPSFTAIIGARIFTGEDYVDGNALLIQGGYILDIVPESKLPSNTQIHACDGGILAPGLIDCQVNGGGNILFNTALSPAAAMDIATAHGSAGTTRLLLTFTSDSAENMQKALVMMREAKLKHQGIIGIHFEGPHLNPERRGVHPADLMRDLKPSDIQFYKPESDEVMLITLAPERAQPELIKQLKNQDVIISLGHSNAETETIFSAFKAGATGVTHIFNAMNGIDARRPGLAGIALNNNDCWCSIIIDGQHVNDEVIRLVYRAKPRGKLFLISDAMPPAGTESPKPFQLYGETIRPEKGRCLMARGRLAGGILTLAECVRYAIKNIGIEPDEAFRMASLYPAEFLGLSKRFGMLKPEYAADAVLFSDDYKVKAAWRNGEKC